MAEQKYILSQILELVHRQVFSRCVDKYHGNYRVRSFSCRDQFICLVFGQLTHRESLRDIVTCLNAQNQKTYVYLTNHLEADAMQIVLFYINRWKVETFFKWIKQHLKIKLFWGERANAVKTQIWVAICTFVLVAMVKERGKIPFSG